MIHGKLTEVLAQIGPAAIAVSGGVDSMTLACVATRAASGYEIFHAISAAVPEQATARVKRYAEREGWTLHLINAGEFDDPQYRANPINRCFFCKSNLYGAISHHTEQPMLSGTNLDDLDDFRPGLRAATSFDVRHPYVEAGIDKSAVRQIARQLALTDLSELPAAPCLASRIETGIKIETADLGLIERVESLLTDQFGPVDLRCRIRKDGLCLEVDEATLTRVPQSEIAQLISKIHKILPTTYFNIDIKPYKRGSAFIGIKSHA